MIIGSIILFISVLYFLTRIPNNTETSNNITAGNVITTYSYVNNFLISLMSIPVAFEMYSRLTNIIKRIN